MAHEVWMSTGVRFALYMGSTRVERVIDVLFFILVLKGNGYVLLLSNQIIFRP